MSSHKICRYKDSIVVAVDSRASVGSYVGSRTVKKVFPIGSHVVATMAGGAADCAHWIRRIACRIRIIQEDFGKV
jgi:20S proteasome subunit beta 5